MNRSLLSPEGLRRLAADVFDCGDIPVCADDEPWPEVVPLDEALREAEKDAQCKSCDKARCDEGCPGRP